LCVNADLTKRSRNFAVLIKDQIRVRREALGMNMAQLAMRVGVSEQAVRHWESGRSYPRKPTIPLLEDALSFVMDWSEGAHPETEGKTAAAMIDQRDVDLLMVICQLPLRAKELLGELARMHLAAVQASRAARPVESEQLSAARTAVFSTFAPAPAQQATSATAPRPARKVRA
jgi:transcriptional regulator with XRE-family HTH domain